MSEIPAIGRGMGAGPSKERGTHPLSRASARFSKFVIKRGTLEYELRKPKVTSNSMILVPLFDFKFLRRTRGTRCRNFKSAALAPFTAPVHFIERVVRSLVCLF